MQKAKQFLLIFILFLSLFIILRIDNVYASSLYEHCNANDNSDASIYSALWGGQTFSTGEVSHNITSIKLLLHRYGSKTGSVYASIRATSEDLPTGSDLTIGSIIFKDITTGTAQWYTFTVTEISLSANTEYAVILNYGAGDSTHYVKWRNDLDALVNGAVDSQKQQPVTSSNGGSSWSSAGSTDYLFEIWGNNLDNTPTNDALTLNLTDASYKDTKTLLCAKQDYKFIYKCSDADGITDITYAEIRLDYTSKNVILRVTRGSGDSWTFSEQSDSSNYVTLNTSACTSSTSDTQKTFNFEIKINWNWGDSAETIGIQAYVIDSFNISDTDNYANIFGVESHISSSNLTVNDYRINPSQALTMSGYWYYNGTSIIPPDGNYNVKVKLSGTQKGSTDTTLVSGFFSINDVISESSVNTYSYTCSADNMSNSGSFSSVIVDKIKVISYSGEIRKSTNVYLDVNVTLHYSYDGNSVTTGIITFNGTTATHLGSGIYRISVDMSIFTNVYCNDVSGNETTYGLNTFDQNSQQYVLMWNSTVFSGTSSSSSEGISMPIAVIIAIIISIFVVLILVEKKDVLW